MSETKLPSGLAAINIEPTVFDKRVQDIPIITECLNKISTNKDEYLQRVIEYLNSKNNEDVYKCFPNLTPGDLYTLQAEILALLRTWGHLLAENIKDMNFSVVLSQVASLPFGFIALVDAFLCYNGYTRSKEARSFILKLNMVKPKQY